MTALGDALKHFRRAEAVYEAYQDSNQRMVHAFDTKVNICSRLAALRDEVAFAPFKGSDMALRRQVYAQQLTILNDLGDTLASLTCAILAAQREAAATQCMPVSVTYSMHIVRLLTCSTSCPHWADGRVVNLAS